MIIKMVLYFDFEKCFQFQYISFQSQFFGCQLSFLPSSLKLPTRTKKLYQLRQVISHVAILEVEIYRLERLRILAI